MRVRLKVGISEAARVVGIRLTDAHFAKARRLAAEGRYSAM